MAARARWLLAILICAGAWRNADAEWQNSLKPRGTNAPEFVLVQEGKPAAGILCTEDATPHDRKAAEELQKWIREITGTTIPINFGGAKGRNILIRTDPRLGDDGYEIRAAGLQLLLWGGTKRGLMNGVFALLEEDLGCRWYTSNSMRLPKTNTLVIAPVVRRYIPQLKLRDPFYACAFDPVWSLRNRTSAPRADVPEEFGGHMDYDGMFVHTAAQLVPAKDYFDSHPEYFARLANGQRSPDQLCATHPVVAAIVAEHIRRALSNSPNTEIVSVSKNDNQVLCHCDRCDKLRADEGSEMANQLTLVNRVAEALEKEFPKLTIDTLAYLKTAPVPKTLRPRKNVAVRLCNDTTGAWIHPFTPAEQCDVAKLLTSWSAVHDRIYIWDYTVNFSHYLAPMPNLDIIAANIRFWVTNHAEGVMLQGGYQGPAERDELKSWVSSKLLWNPALDEKALTEDFIWGYYGKAAPAMDDYETLLGMMRLRFAKEMGSPPGGIRYPMRAPFITKEFVDKGTEIFSRATDAAKGDEVLTRRVERAKLPILYVQCSRPDLAGEDYPIVLAEFERIARQQNATHLKEGAPDLESKLAQFKTRIAKTAQPK